MKVCSYEDKISNCQRPVYCKGLCSTHYAQQWKTGKLFPTPADIPVRMRFMEKVLITPGGCWEWQGTKTKSGSGNGYGQIMINGRTVRAHRFGFEKLNGPIPKGMDIDHICFNTMCVNVDHLRVASRKENVEHHNGARRNSKTGVRGVFLNERTQKYQVRAMHNGKLHSGGYFTDLAEAEQAAIALRNRLHTFNNRDREEILT